MKVEAIIVHCTATAAGRPFTAADVDVWHKARGWQGIGYHYLVRLDGTIERGRPETRQGAHCAASGMNRRSLGVCYVGGVDDQGRPADTRTPEQRAALLRLLSELKSRYPAALIRGHRDYDRGKACPSFNAKKEYERL